MSKPHIKNENLVIPFDSPQKYHWWNGGQSITETLNELNVSSEVRRKYTHPGGKKK